MSKLDPRPDNSGRLYSWNELNDYLQAIFRGPGDNETIIDPTKYAMPKEEIIIESEKQGYRVTETPAGYLKFN